MTQPRLTRHQVLLFEGQYARLNELYAKRSAAEVIRELVRRHIEGVERRAKEIAEIRERKEKEDA